VNSHGYPEGRARATAPFFVAGGGADGVESYFGVAQFGAVAAELAQAQLWNPPTSVRVLRVRRMVHLIGATASMDLRFYTAELPTFQLRGLSSRVSPNASRGELRTWSAAAALGTKYADVQTQAFIQGEIIDGFQPRLSPGQGIGLSQLTVNVAIRVLFEWDEVPVDAPAPVEPPAS